MTCLVLGWSGMKWSRSTPTAISCVWLEEEWNQWDRLIQREYAPRRGMQLFYPTGGNLLERDANHHSTLM